MKNIYIFLFDGFSDWEIAYLTPEVAKSNEFKIKTFSLDGNPIYSMGRLKITPDCSLKDIDKDNISMLILPGGYEWQDNKLDYIIPLISEMREKKTPVAAICGASIFLAMNGFLNDIKHTSNDKDYLKFIAKDYSGEHLYQMEGAYTDDNVITASGIAPIEFTREILNCLSFDKETIKKWYQLFKNGIWSN